ncbi:MAG TPA: DUF1800 domain-containing protein, partial [Planctomycetota bacterium]|nr:DUF1800 domain-containing protein [Planctomycetota bacterium]
MIPLPRDGDEALAPYAPSTSAPWDRRLAAHLLRRAGFGGSEAEIDEALSAGPAAAAESLAHPPADDEAVRSLDESMELLLDGKEPVALRSWWALRMVATKAPLR